MIQKRLTAVLATIICITTVVPIFGTREIPEEKGDAFIDNLFCTKEGDCMVFYHREYMPSDVMQHSIPYIRVVRVSREGEFQNLTPSFPVPSTQRLLADNTWGLVQEDNDTLRLIGWVEGNLTEIKWSKHNETLEIHNNYVGHNNVLFPQQVRYENELRNYILVGYSHGTKRNLAVISTNGTTTRFIKLQDILFPDISHQYWFSSYAAFIATNSSEAFFVYATHETYIISVRHISNLIVINDTRFDLNSTLEYTIKCSDTLLGLDGDPYLGVRILRSKEKSSDRYQNKFELINLRRCTSLIVTIPSKAKNFGWKGLIDASGNFHGFFSDYKQNKTRYVRITKEGDIELNTTFYPGFGNVHSLQITFWGNNYIVGGIDDGMFLFELSSGKLINFEAEVIAFISYYQGIRWDFFYGIPGLIVIVIFWRKKRST